MRKLNLKYLSIKPAQPLTISRVGKTFAKAVHRFYWPKTFLGLVAIALAIQPAIHQLTGLLIHPTMNEYLRSRGLSHADAKKLSPKTFNLVKPVPQHRGTLDWLHSTTEFPLYFGLALSFLNAASPSLGYTVTRTFTCSINIKDAKRFSTRNFFADNILMIKRSSFRDIPVSDEHVSLAITLHEGSHCDTEKNIGGIKDQLLGGIPDTLLKNSALRYKRQDFINEREYHSDTEAAKAIENLAGNKNIHDFTLAFRSVSPFYISSEDLDYEHDIALRLDAARKGIKEPTIEDIINSRKEIAPLVKARLESILGRPVKTEWHLKMLIPDFSYEEKPFTSDKGQIAILQSADYVLKEHGNKLSHYAKRRLELYIEGVHYFAPSVVEEALKQEPKKTPPQVKAVAPGVS